MYKRDRCEDVEKGERENKENILPTLKILKTLFFSDFQPLASLSLQSASSHSSSPFLCRPHWPTTDNPILTTKTPTLPTHNLPSPLFLSCQPPSPFQPLLHQVATRNNSFSPFD